MRREIHQPVSIDVVIEGQLLVPTDGPLGENPHSNSVPDGPFCDVAVGIAAVVCEPSDPAFLRRVNELHVAPHLAPINYQTETRERTSSF